MAETFGKLATALVEAATNVTALPAPSIKQFRLAELEALPARLDNPTMRELREFFNSRLPVETAASTGEFAECFRTMQACLPRQGSDDLAGELMFAAYRQHLGHLGPPALRHLQGAALRSCRWFPTIAECLELAASYYRSDAETEARALARKLFNREDDMRRAEEREERRLTDWRVQ